MDGSLDIMPYSHFVLQAERFDDNEKAVLEGKETQSLDDYLSEYESLKDEITIHGKGASGAVILAEFLKEKVLRVHVKGQVLSENWNMN
jgi:hypothetical protein